MAFNLPALLGSLATFPGFVLFGCFQLVCFQCWTQWVNLLSLFFMPESMFAVLTDASCVCNGIYTVLLDWVLRPSFWASGLKTNGSLLPAKLTWRWCAGKLAVWGKTQIWSLLISVVEKLPPQLISSHRCDGRDVLTQPTLGNWWELAPSLLCWRLFEVLIQTFEIMRPSYIFIGWVLLSHLFPPCLISWANSICFIDEDIEILRTAEGSC